MNQSQRINTSICFAAFVCVMAAHITIQRNNLDYQTHPFASILGSIIPGICIGFISYWVSGWNAKRKQKKLDDDFLDKTRIDLQIQTKLAEHGNVSSQIKTEIAEANNAVKPEVNRKMIGLCPKCKSEVLETNTGYYCGAFDCNFKLPAKVLGQVLDSSQAAKLLLGRKTDLLSGLVSKDGRIFSAALFLDAKGKVTFDSQKQELHAAASDVPTKFNYSALLAIGIVILGLFLLIYDTRWEHISSVEGGFSVDFPSKPEIKHESGRVNDTRFKDAVFFTADKGQISYFVGYADDFDDVVEQTSIEDRLDGARDDAIKGLNGTMNLKLETQISKNGFLGREIVFQGNAGDVLCRVYIVGKRKFTLLVAGQNIRYAKDTQRFFDSFALLPN